MSKTTRNLRTYEAGMREKAVKRAEQIGYAAASLELGIPKGTVSAWLSKHRQSKNEEPPTATDATSEEPTDAKADLPKVKAGTLVAKLYTPSQKAQALELANASGVTAACRELGMSRSILYDWIREQKRFAEGKFAKSPLLESGAPKKEDRDERILKEWRAHPGLGPSQVRNQLRRQGFKVSIHTVRCVLEDHGYVTPKVRRQDATHEQRFESVRPNHTWHLDFLHRHINKQKVYVLLIVDDFSRFIVGGALWDGERVAAVQETFEAAVSRHGKPEKALSDGGSAFYAWRGVGQFTRLLEELEVDQIIAQTPQTNGKLEVLNANIQKELFNQETFFDLGEAQRRLMAWISFYNFRRTHHALGGLLVPADRYFGRADLVLASLDAGGKPDGIGEPIAVGERQLDLFRLSSHRGQLELHILGQRIPIPR